jgi:hypothetical protein
MKPKHYRKPPANGRCKCGADVPARELLMYTTCEDCWSVWARKVENVARLLRTRRSGFVPPFLI